MERPAKSDPAKGKPLTAAQKTRLARAGPRLPGQSGRSGKIFLKKQLNDAYAAQKADEAEKVQQQLAAERARIDEERDEAKERVRREA